MGQQKAVSLVIADDHPAMREGLVNGFRERGFDVLGEAGDGEAAVDLVERHDPDVALLDLKMPGLSGAEAAGKLRSLGVRTRVLILSAHNEGELVRDAVEAGAVGYIDKKASRAKICDAVARVAAGKTYIDEAVLPGFLTALSTPTDSPLSDRELEILRHIARGASNPEIAAELVLSVETVKSHAKNLFAKLEVTSRAAAVDRAHQLGLLDK